MFWIHFMFVIHLHLFLPELLMLCQDIQKVCQYIITCICETSAVNLLSRPTCSCSWQKHWPLSSVTCNTDTESGSRTITSLWWHAWNHITQSSLFTLCLGLCCLDWNIVAVGLLYFQVQASIHVDLGLKLKIKRFCLSHPFLENYW